MKTLSSCLQKLVYNECPFFMRCYLYDTVGRKIHSMFIVMRTRYFYILNIFAWIQIEILSFYIFSMLLRNDLLLKYVNVKTVPCPQCSSSNSIWLKAAMRYRVMGNRNAFYITNTAMPLALHEMFTLLNVCFVHENEKKIELGV